MNVHLRHLFKKRAGHVRLPEGGDTDAAACQRDRLFIQHLSGLYDLKTLMLLLKRVEHLFFIRADFIYTQFHLSSIPFIDFFAFGICGFLHFWF